METNRKVIVYIATSIDGFIAKTDGDISFLDTVAGSGEDYGYSDFINSVDTVIMGRKTYDKVLSFGIGNPHAAIQSYIITRTERKSEDNVTFYTGDITALVNALKSNQGKHIFVDGGAEIVNLLLQHRLIDEIIISIVPVLLGEGIRLFDTNRPPVQMQLVGSTQYASGLVQIHYKLPIIC